MITINFTKNISHEELWTLILDNELNINSLNGSYPNSITAECETQQDADNLINLIQ